jgi:sulfoxide reductase heme-binding subunit YedZ
MPLQRAAALRTITFVGCSTPFILLVLQAFEIGAMTLGPNPVETVLHALGTTGLNLLLLTLAVTPARQLTGLNVLVRVRRMLGLFCFFYALLHFLVYALLDLRLAWSTLFVDITERPYITVGMLALVGMVPLAVTSTNGWQRRLRRRWVSLHRLVYPIAILALVHFFWQVKLDTTEPLIYAGILTLLLGYRLFRRARFSLRRRAG